MSWLTGRQRGVVTLLDVQRKTRNEYLVTGTVPNFNIGTSTVTGYSTAANMDWSLHSVETEFIRETEIRDSDSFYRRRIRMQVTVILEYPGGPPGGDERIFQTDWQNGPWHDPSVPEIVDEFVPYLEYTTCDVHCAGEMLLKERCTGSDYEEIVYSAEGEVTITAEGDAWDAGDEALYSFSLTDGWTVETLDGAGGYSAYALTNYRHHLVWVCDRASSYSTWDAATVNNYALTPLPETTLYARALPSGTGLDYTNRTCDTTLGGTSGGGTLIGTTYEATLTLGEGPSTQATPEVAGSGGNIDSDSAEAETLGEPDWAVNITLFDRDYETGDSVEVTHFHRWKEGSHVVVNPILTQWEFDADWSRTTWTTAPYLYPVTGVAFLKRVTFLLDDGETADLGSSIITDRDLWSGIERTVQVDPAWANTYGTLLWSANLSGSQYDLHATEPFDLATLNVPATHEYQHFEDAGDWINAAFGIGNIHWFHGSGSGETTINLTHLGVGLRPFAHRYHKVTVKSDTARTRIDFKLFRDTDWTYVWHLDIEAADTLETKTLDLAFPDEILYDGEPGDRHVVHPQLVVNDPFGYFGMGLSTTAAPFTKFWVYGLQGYFRPEVGSEDRYKLLLHAPLCVNGLGEPGDGEANVEAETCSGGTETNGGGIWGQLVPNGLCGLRFASGDTTLLAAWTDFRDDFGTAAADTGIEIALTTDALALEIAAAARHYNGYAASGALWRQMTPGTPFTVQGRLRLTQMYGYYGMGDPTGEAFDGSYHATLYYRGDRYWNGAALGLVWKIRHEKNIQVDLLNSVTEALVDTDTSNLDGFYQVFGRYGHGKTFDNGDWEGTDLCQLEYSGSEWPYTYTATGEVLAPYLARGAKLTPRDSENVLLTGKDEPRLAVCIVDRFPTWYDLPGTGARSVDAALDRTRTRKFVFYEKGDDLALKTFTVGSDGRLEDAGDLLTVFQDAACPAISQLPDGRLGLSGVTETGVKYRYWGKAQGLFAVQDIGSGELADHIQDDQGRTIFAVYDDDDWKVIVGTKQSGSQDLALSSPVSMGLADPERVKGSLELISRGTIGFVYVKTDGSIRHTLCRGLQSNGTGTWV